MAKTFKVGDKVRILDVDSIKYGNEHWSNGDITEITGFFGADKKYPFLKRTKGGYAIGSNHLTPEELRYIALVDATPTKKQRIEALEKANADLVTEVEALKARIEALEKAKEIDISARIAEKKTPMSANQRRKAAIERAKAFVADVEKKASKGCGKFEWYLTKPEYHINKEKRVVTVLVKGAVNPKLYEKAIARCAPGDVFNEHIGKAIALAKAYGLECPKEFTDAPQPEPAIGQIIKNNGYAGGTYRATGITKDSVQIHNSKRYFTFKYAQILDDTEAQYE